MSNLHPRIQKMRNTEASTKKFFDAFQKLIDLNKSLDFDVIANKKEIKDYLAKCFVEGLNEFEQLIVQYPETFKILAAVNQMNLGEIEDAWWAYFHFEEDDYLLDFWRSISDKLEEELREEKGTSESFNPYEMSELDFRDLIEEECPYELLDDLPFDLDHKHQEILAQAGIFLKWNFFGIEELDSYLSYYFAQTFKSLGIQLNTKYSLYSEEIKFLTDFSAIDATLDVVGIGNE